MNISKLSSLKDRYIRGEENITSRLNIIGHYNENTLIDRDGRLIQILRIHGINAYTTDSSKLQLTKNRRNNLLKSFNSKFALYIWELRRRSQELPMGEYPDGYAKTFHESYQQAIKQHDLFENHLYVALVTKQADGLISKGLNILKTLSMQFDKAAYTACLAESSNELDIEAQRLKLALKAYQPEILSLETRGEIVFSKPLEFISTLVNYDPHRIAYKKGSIQNLLARKKIFFDRRAGLIEIKAGDQSKKYAAAISIKEYMPKTFQGMLDEISSLKVEFTLCQSYRFYHRQMAKKTVENQQNDMLQSNEESISQINELDTAYDEAASGTVGYGKHQFTLICYADSIKELNQNIGLIISSLLNLNLVGVREDIASECAYWSILPCNFNYIVRPAPISSENFAAFASLHNLPRGRKDGNHWGDALTLLETVNGTPYYFTNHYRDIGHFAMFGGTGGGKTTLLGLLILQSLKFGGLRVILDRGRGTEILTRALNGSYSVLKVGQPTDMNPCLLEDTKENRDFLFLLIKTIVKPKGDLTPTESETIWRAVSGIYGLPIENRRFRHLAPYLGARGISTLRDHFEEWHSEGRQAWVFDNAEDSLFEQKALRGFDLEHILKQDQVKVPVLMYLVHRNEQDAQNQRSMLLIDEGWQALTDDFLLAKINASARGDRKKDNCLGIFTQVAADATNLPGINAIIESINCKIIFPNASATREVYMDQLGLSEREYELVVTMPDDQFYFLLIYGRGENRESVVLRANLKGMEKEILILSAREDSLIKCDLLRANYGDHPDNWLHFMQKKEA